MLKYFVPCTPFGKQRARTFRRGGRSITYTPEQTVAYERLLSEHFLRNAAHSELPLRGMYRVDIVCVFPRTKVLSAVLKDGTYKHGGGRILMGVKPDEDNIRKSVLDSISEYIEGGDSRVVGGTTLKLYQALDYHDEPGLHIRIRAVNLEMVCDLLID